MREAPLSRIAARIASSACRCSFGWSAPAVGSFIPFSRVAVRSVALRNLAALCFLPSLDNLWLGSFMRQFRLVRVRVSVRAA
ncbi:MAG TPA: hypothetical protein VKD23_20690 [Terriglobales bacterium]|nr:hypothetical protein [Terriglobales bacterium]